MEPKPDENKTGSKPDMFETISSDDDANKSNLSPSSKEKTEESEETSTNKSPERDDSGRPSSRSSAETTCAICLEPLHDKSFSDGCSHTFCYLCLMEWSKVKPECPLCKKRFKYIMHNIREDTFDKHYVESMQVHSYYDEYFGPAHHRIRYRTPVQPPRTWRHFPYHFESIQSQIASHRMRYAPHSVAPYPGTLPIRMSCPFRRSIYEQNMWTIVPPNSTTRLATPEFYQRNPACTHRLIPWLNRELTSLFPDNEGLVTFILELIMSVIVKYHIESYEFRCLVEPYFGRHTEHFIHEFHSFASSPYGMENYDRDVGYGLAPIRVNDSERSSPDSDVIAILSPGNTSVPKPSKEVKRKGPSDALKHLKMILKKNGGNKWESYLSTASSSGSNPGPSTSGLRTSNFLPVNGNIPDFTSLSDVYQSDDEIQVVNVLKPLGERTPEIVNLSSDEEALVPVINVSSDENLSPVNSPSRLAAVSAYKTSNDVEFISEHKPYSWFHFHKIPKEKVTKIEEQKQMEEESIESSSTTEELESDDSTEEMKKPKLASAIIMPWTYNSKLFHSSHTVEGESSRRSRTAEDESFHNPGTTESESSCRSQTAEGESSCNPGTSESESSRRSQTAESESSHNPRTAKSESCKIQAAVNESSRKPRAAVNEPTRRLQSVVNETCIPRMVEGGPSGKVPASEMERNRSVNNSSSDSSDADRSCNRKLKLKSVVATFTVAHTPCRRESCHRHSSRRNHKEKKKHKRRRINPISSDSE